MVNGTFTIAEGSLEGPNIISSVEAGMASKMLWQDSRMLATIRPAHHTSGVYEYTALIN